MATQITLVKFFTDDDGETVDEPIWHASVDYGDANRTICGGEVFGFGESIAKFKTKKGTIRSCKCRRCLEVVKWYKSL